MSKRVEVKNQHGQVFFFEGSSKIKSFAEDLPRLSKSRKKIVYFPEDQKFTNVKRIASERKQ